MKQSPGYYVGAYLGAVMVWLLGWATFGLAPRLVRWAFRGWRG